MIASNDVAWAIIAINGSILWCIRQTINWKKLAETKKVTNSRYLAYMHGGDFNALIWSVTLSTWINCANFNVGRVYELVEVRLISQWRHMALRN